MTVVIVNHNTVEDLRRCLASLRESEHTCSFEIHVVDNASTDGSGQMVREEFPDVRLRINDRNVGFAKGNNPVIEASRSEFVLLLNPDTIVFDHALDPVVEFLRRSPDVGMATCRLVQEDGSLDLACRRTFPNAFDGLCRALGLAELFPKSPTFARYNMSYLDEDALAEVDAINGAFMMVRRTAIEEVGLLDEDYYMYMEDLQWCYAFREHGWKIYYVPESTIIHFKGRSSRKNSDAMIRAFFESMEIFCRKVYRPRYNPLAYASTILGIRLWKWSTLMRNAFRFEGRKRVRP